MPNDAGSNSGAQSASVKKLRPTSPKKEIASFSSAARIRTVVRTEIAAATNSAALIACSPRRGFATPRGLTPGAAPPIACEPASTASSGALPPG